MTLHRSVGFSLGALAILVAVRATLPAQSRGGVKAFTGARVIDGTDRAPIDNATIVVREGRVAAVGPAGKVKRPAGAKVVDVAGKTIIPGFVDVHSHMWPPRGVHQTQVWQYLANLAYGVTTTRDPQTSTSDVFEYADLVETGDILGPRVLATGPGIFSSDGLEDKETADAFIKRYKEAYKTDTVKEYVTGDRIVRQWVILAAM